MTPRRRAFRARPWVRQVHLWVGLALSVVLLVVAITGSALTYKEAYWRMVYPELRGPAPELTARDHAAAVEAARARFGDGLRSVKLPEPGVNAYHLYLSEGEAFLSVEDHAVVDVWGPRDRPMAFLFDLHAHLLAGENGEKVNGILALLGAALVLTGVYLWWPARRAFNLRTLLPTALTRRGLLPGHRDVGTLTAPLLLVLLITGAGIVYYAPTGAILNAVLPGPAPTSEAAPAVTGEQGGVGPLPTEPRLLHTVDELFPDARLVFYYPPTESNPIHGFRLKRPCELHPNGRSFVYLDAGGRTLRSVDACAQPPGQKALYAVYPLHSGKTESALYKLAVFLGGLALTLVSATGAGAYLAKIVGGRSGPRGSAEMRREEMRREEEAEGELSEARGR